MSALKVQMALEERDYLDKSNMVGQRFGWYIRQ
jgi:hypothetical protein